MKTPTCSTQTLVKFIVAQPPCTKLVKEGEKEENKVTHE